MWFRVLNTVRCVWLASRFHPSGGHGPHPLQPFLQYSTTVLFWGSCMDEIITVALLHGETLLTAQSSPVQDEGIVAIRETR
jgi:hypothetical protein